MPPHGDLAARVEAGFDLLQGCHFGRSAVAG
jgi:hypothetical protein